MPLSFSILPKGDKKSNRMENKIMTKTSAKFDIYEFINNEIITQLENGVIPWLKPWTGRADSAYSRATGKLPSNLFYSFY